MICNRYVGLVYSLLGIQIDTKSVWYTETQSLIGTQCYYVAVRYTVILL